MTTFYDNSAIDPEPMEFLIIDGRPAFRRLGPDLPYGEKYEVAETIDRPMPRPCVPLPVCLEPPVFAEVPADVLDSPIAGTALPTDAGADSYATAWSDLGGFGDVWTYGDVTGDRAVSFSLDLLSMKQGHQKADFVIFTARPHGWQYDHPAPVPLPAAGLLLIAALVGLRIVWRK